MYAFIFFFDWPHFLLFKFHSPCSAIWTVGRSLQTSTKQTISFALFCVIIALTRTCAESIRKRESLSRKPRLRRWECKSGTLAVFSHFFASTPKYTKTVISVTNSSISLVCRDVSKYNRDPNHKTTPVGSAWINWNAKMAQMINTRSISRKDLDCD